MQDKLIIFDIDGTLTNTNHVDSVFFEKAILDVLPISSINTEWHNYRYSTDTGILTEIVQSKLDRNPTLNEIDSIKNRFVSYLENAFSENQSNCIPINGSQTIFEKISQLGWDIGIATGGWEKSALLKLKTANIPHQTIPIAHSDDHVERENIISIAISRAQECYKKLSYSKIIYVGDRLWDKVAANNLKIDFIGVGDTLGIIENKDFFHISDFTNTHLEQYLTKK
ncbi:MAG: hypothetical protein A3F42_03575 [Gammaproteobacteria bacterium RIFCSPHIGHO2_12_FULL_37_34]|nr:MAG: hypothetical protein A3F42_03575 [Gammaproteobacteria bacterium RIFCSPHIGHO2_12_FULL_37_34]